MTNDVMQNVTANVLLALYASPAMVIDPEEAAQFVVLADALLINVGTPTRDRRDAMLAVLRPRNDRLGKHAARGESLAVVGADRGGYSGSGQRHRADAPFSSLVVINGDEKG